MVTNQTKNKDYIIHLPPLPGTGSFGPGSKQSHCSFETDSSTPEVSSFLYSSCTRQILSIVPVAPVDQLVTSQPSDTLGREFESR